MVVIILVLKPVVFGCVEKIPETGAAIETTGSIFFTPLKGLALVEREGVELLDSSTVVVCSVFLTLLPDGTTGANFNF